MNDESDTGGPEHSGYPKIVAATSLYARDPEKNADKEYHMQVVEIEPGKALLNFQYGRRGNKLAHKCKTPNAVGVRVAMGMMRDKIFEEKAKGYQEIDLGGLQPAYAILAHYGLGTLGVDLFMARDKTSISMVQYTSSAGDPAAEGRAVATSYQAHAASHRALAMVGVAIEQPTPQQAEEGLALAQEKLRSSNLTEFGVFVGYKGPDGVVVPGLPPMAGRPGLRARP